MDPAEYGEVVAYKLRKEYPANLTKREKLLLRRKASLYDIEGEELYYWRYKRTDKSIKTKVVCGAEDADEIFNDFHAGPVHSGKNQTRDAISRRFYWPGMSRDIQKRVSQCSVCQASGKTLKTPSKVAPIQVSQPFELVGMGFIGKLTQTEKGHQYICVMIDYLTRWPQAYPLRSKTSEEVSQCIVKLILQFEAPKQILTDQGKEFVNDVNKGVCQILDIKRTFCSLCRPKTNAWVKRMNVTIQRSLSKVVGLHPETWDDHLDAVMFGLRTKQHMTTKYSPFYLMFGREARYPSEVPEHYTFDSTVEDVLAREELTRDVKRVLAEQQLKREKVECLATTQAIQQPATADGCHPPAGDG